ncbi:restriction endonuclease subunit R [Aminipila terrae]|uniref:Restriction endonuclease subunit R n=1 Tax=Aminipila terrae TaxID=2697030 RepID=A0A6P1MH51_9FIRM|nr:restriction endonuclease subunit R [Aminipila terrae]QHI73071.1 restriction endonuclease subunit R [Aminipila terrae]
MEKIRQKKSVEIFAEKWGVDAELLSKSLSSYSDSQPDFVPYIDELMKTADFDKATNQSAGNRLGHIIRLTKELPIWIARTKQKYS